MGQIVIKCNDNINTEFEITDSGDVKKILDFINKLLNKNTLKEEMVNVWDSMLTKEQ